ncbi:MarR family winged helix-turn-helix transcriptional regulator [Paenibacillus sp. CAA11]|uniref:MarR family winged helix-turn-helix transcriptional regulator n=1 Tax=Paenibacillus sp. CAA11 TaxID=1532905 RepID=UPI001F2B280F|nr:MarR family transcriptional regulator [Paenibacillus sp. CAA11]
MRNKLDQSLGFFLGLTYRKVSHLLLQRLKEYNITPEQWSVLVRIGERDGMIQKEIGERAAKDKPTTTRLLIALEEKGFIRKIGGEADRRSFLIYITDKGREVLQKTEPIEHQVMEEVTEGIPQAELELLLKQLNQVAQNADYLLDKEKE